MKKSLNVLFASALLVGCSTVKPAETTVIAQNFTDEMKIEDGQDLDPVYGADSVERDGDHAASPYFTNLDFYNMESTDTLSILTHFKTIQQSSEWSCGVASSLMVLEWYGKRNDLGEVDLAQYRSNGTTPEGTSLKQVIGMFDQIGGFKLESTYDHEGEDVWDFLPMSRFKEEIDAGHPIQVAWNDWGGHWQVIIGYDDMGTETTQDDVLIMADPYDTTDHNQDGYVVYPAERFYYNWTMFDFFEGYEDSNERDYLFLIAVPEEK